MNLINITYTCVSVSLTMCARLKLLSLLNRQMKWNNNNRKIWKYPAHRKNMTFIRVLIQNWNLTRSLEEIEDFWKVRIWNASDRAVRIFWFGIEKKKREREIRRKKKKKRRKKKEKNDEGRIFLCVRNIFTFFYYYYFISFVYLIMIIVWIVHT